MRVWVRRGGQGGGVFAPPGPFFLGGGRPGKGGVWQAGGSNPRGGAGGGGFPPPPGLFLRGGARPGGGGIRQRGFPPPGGGRGGGWSPVWVGPPIGRIGPIRRIGPISPRPGLARRHPPGVETPGW